MLNLCLKSYGIFVSTWKVFPSMELYVSMELNGQDLYKAITNMAESPRLSFLFHHEKRK